MSQTKKKKGPTKAEMARKVVELEAQLTSAYHFAGNGLKQAAYPKFLASAVIVQVTALGGRELMQPVAIRGGLSPETIEHLLKDIQRSYEEATEFKPVAPSGTEKTKPVP